MTKPTFSNVIAKIEGFTKGELREYFASRTAGRGKGVRGWAFEELCGVDKTSDLNDLEDGELKTVAIGGHLNVTQLQHTLHDILIYKPFERTKLYKKLQKTIICYFDKSTGDFEEIRALDLRNHKELTEQLKEDYYALAEYIRCSVVKGRELSGKFKSPNGLLNLPTSGYGTIKIMGRTISSKYYRSWGVRSTFLNRVLKEGYDPLVKK